MAAKIFEITYVACIALWMGTAVLYYYVLKSSSALCMLPLQGPAG